MCAAGVNPVKTSRNLTSVAVRTIAQILMQLLKDFATPSVSGKRKHPFLSGRGVVLNMLLAAAIVARFHTVYPASTSTEESANANASFLGHVRLATTSTRGPVDVKGLSTPSDPLLD